jgi:hypothetical protein
MDDYLPKQLWKAAAQVAAAEETFLQEAIRLAGFAAVASPDAEWRKHMAMEHFGNGVKVILVDGKPRWRIVTEAPSTRFGDDRIVIIEDGVTVRMEPI